MKTPVALLIFNRPDTTKRVFKAIRQAKPPQLLVVADGPRQERPEEAKKCQAAQQIINGVDWDCQVLANYSSINLGCKKRVSSGLDWVFSLVEEAIILEDDCLPHPTFFQFCEELLAKYRHDRRMMAIYGTNFQGDWKSDRQSYHFSYYGCIWGWATWKRAWDYYDVDMKLWANPDIQGCVRDVICDPQQYQLRKQRFDTMYAGKVDSWDLQWLFACLFQSGLAVIPAVNLVSNIGFGAEATHTKDEDDSLANLPVLPMTFPLKEPAGVAVDREYDYRLYLKLFKQKTLIQRFWRRVKRLLKKRSG
ncbi:MAG: glycosyltransferase family 2 protein [Cyanophyceae cyanobacterium]